MASPITGNALCCFATARTPVHTNQCIRPMSASARYRPLLTCILKSRSFGQTRKRTRVVASKSTLDLPITLKATRNKRNQGNTETVSHEYWFVESQEEEYSRGGI